MSLQRSESVGRKFRNDGARRTMRTALEHTFKSNKEQPLFGRLLSAEEPVWLTFGDVSARVKIVAAMLHSLCCVEERMYASTHEGKQLTRRPFVAISGPNALEWLVADWGASGCMIPSVGLHPEWPAAKIYQALRLSGALIIVTTSIASLAETYSALSSEPKCAVKHIVLLDATLCNSHPSFSASGSSCSANILDKFQSLPEIHVWCARGTSEQLSNPADAGTVPVASLLALHSAIDQWAYPHAPLCAPVSPGLSRATSMGDCSSCPMPDALFPVLDEGWLSDAAKVASAQALFRPLASASDIAATATRAALASGHSAADWMAAAAVGPPEARADVACIWSILFATGSSGALKATPLSRAGWACSNGAWGDGKLPPGVGNNTVLSCSALSHGLDRGSCWRAVLGGGRIGMVGEAHSNTAVRHALRVFRPATFVAMPSFWTHLYVQAIDDAAAVLREQLLATEEGGGDSIRTAPGQGADRLGDGSTSRSEREAIVAGLVTEQLRGIPQLLKDTRQQRGARGLLRSPDGLLCHAWLARPQGALAHALQTTGMGLRDSMSLPNNDVKMGSGGAGISEDVLTFFNWVVFVSRFRDHYGATEAPGIAEGAGAMEVNSGVQVRAVADSTCDNSNNNNSNSGTVGVKMGELEVACPGGPVRYFGADDGDQDAIAASHSAFTPDGWWRSGDLVELTVRGTHTWLRVRGRVADQIELYADGDSVWLSASQLAATYSSATVVHAGQLVIQGKRDDALLVAVMVPAEPWVRSVLAQHWPHLLCEGDAVSPLAALAAPGPDAAQARLLLATEALRELRWYGGQMGLPTLQLLAGVLIDPVPWSAAAGTVGAVAKPLRRAVLNLHHEAIELLFEKAKLQIIAAVPTAIPSRTAPVSILGPASSPVQVALAAADAAVTLSQSMSTVVWTAWQALVASVAQVRQKVLLVPDSLPAVLAPTQHSPWTGLLADLWALVSAELKTRLGLGDTVCDDSNLFSAPLYGLGCVATSFSREPPAYCDLEALSQALSAPSLFVGLGSAGCAVQLVRVMVPQRRAGFAADGQPTPSATVEHTEGHLVVACVPVHCSVSLLCLRRAAAAYGAPQVAWPVALAHCASDALAAGLQYAAHLADAMMPWATRDNAEVYGWSIPALPDSEPVQQALDAARASARRYWHCVDTEGNLVDRSAARTLIKDDVEAAFAGCEAVLTGAAQAVEAQVQVAVGSGESIDPVAVVRAAAALNACVRLQMPPAMEQVREVLGIQSKLEQACLAEVPSIGAAAAQHIAACTALSAAAVRAGIPLPWQVKTLDFAPPKGLLPAETGSATQVGDIVFSAIPPVDCALTGRPLWHCGLVRDEDYPVAAVNMECGSSSSPATLSLPVFDALSRIAAALNVVRQAVARGLPGSAGLESCVLELQAGLQSLDPTIASGGMFALERNFHWKQAFPFGWDSVHLSTDTPTPAAFVHTALRTWGPRPCLGTPLEHAKDCVLACLPGDSPMSPHALLVHNTFTISHDFAWLTYAQLDPVVHALARNLRGIPGLQRGHLLGICANNCVEWLAADWAAALAGLCCVGFHVTYTAEELADTASRVQPAVVMVAPALLPVWLALVRRQLLTGLRAIVVLQRAHEFANSLGEVDTSGCIPMTSLGPAPSVSSLGMSLPLLVSFEDLAHSSCLLWDTVGALEQAAENPMTQTPGRPDGLFTLLFTSGSSGQPKGVMISADAWRRDIGDYPPACRSYAWPFVNPSFIPLSHSSDRVRCWDTLGRGGRVGFCFYGAENWIAHQTGKKSAALQEHLLTQSSNNVETLVLHLAALRPTSLALPPRVWNGIKWLWDAAHCASPPSSASAASPPVHHRALELLRKAANLDQAFGQRVLVLASGGAAPNPAVMAWVQTQFPGRPYHESYGATECGAITENFLPMPRDSGRGLLYRLEPQAGFPHPRYGEMVVQTPTMALGYWQDAAATAAAFGSDGFWRTGDLCEARPDGSVVVVERIGALVAVPWQDGVRLLAPASIEAALTSSLDRVACVQGLCVEQLCCVSLPAAGGQLVAAVCLRGVALSSNPSPLCPTPTIYLLEGTSAVTVDTNTASCAEAAMVLQWLRAAAQAAQLPPWAWPAGVALVPQRLWTACEGGLLNVQHKIARKRVQSLLALLPVSGLTLGGLGGGAA